MAVTTVAASGNFKTSKPEKMSSSEIVVLIYSSAEGVSFICGQTTKRGPLLFRLIVGMLKGKKNAYRHNVGDQYYTVSNDRGEKIESFDKKDLSK